MMRITKIFSVIVMLAMAGCATGPSMEALESQALLTGDWGAVEKRERALARRQARQAPSCSDGRVAFCEYRLNQKVCSCLSRESMRMALTFR